MRLSPLLAPLIALALGATPSFSTPPAPIALYSLGPEAAVQAGCLPPCDCPVELQSPVSGTFRLAPDVFDGTFMHYRVVDVAFGVGPGDVLLGVRGSGTYRVSGDQQHLILDLDDGGGVRRFDSGLTAGGSSFPKIRVALGLHGLVCRDTVLGIDATTEMSVPGPRTTETFSLRLGPNPFRGSAQIDFSLPKDGFVNLRVHDLSGREVRVLAAGRFNAGPHTVSWDGRDASGRRVAVGVYFVRLQGAGRETRGSLVKLD